MNVYERIRITEFDRPSSWYATLVTSSGYEVKDLGDSIVMRGMYAPGKYEALVEMIAASGMTPKIFRGFSTEWSDEEFARADLVSLTLPGLDVDGFYEETQCPQCGRGMATRDYSRRVSKMKAKYKVGTAGIWADLVHKTAKERAGRELRGVAFVPFDEAGEYFYLRAVNEIQQQTIRPEDGINVREACPVCGRFQYDVFFGPLRYRREGWNGDDVVYSHFTDTLLFTPMAYELLRSFDRHVERFEPLYLE